MKNKVATLKAAAPLTLCNPLTPAFFLITLALLSAGCLASRPLKGGKALTSRTPTGDVAQTLIQGDNPAQASKQDLDIVRIRTYTLAPGTRIQQSPASLAINASTHLSTNPAAAQSFVLTAPTPVTEREETHARTELGAAQKDTARELAAKLSSLKGIVWIGIATFLFGLTSLVWPPVRVMIGSVTTSAALIAGGLALIILPTLIVGNEILILGAVALIIAAWFLAHRHGHLRGTLDARKLAK